jgi:tetratricopeptide (TPR) repeat protein
MQIDTYATNSAGLTTLLETTLGAYASAGSAASAVDFGSAALVSIGSGPADGTALNDLYTQLAGLSLQLRAPTAPQLSPRQQEAEQEAIEQATALRIQGAFDQARDVIAGVLEDNPTNAVAIHALGAIELDLGNYEAAEGYFRKAHYFDPSYGFDRDASNARILQRDDDHVLEQARRLTANPDTRGDGVRLLIALTRRSPADAVARSLLAENLIAQGDAAQGLAQYQLAISSADQVQAQWIEAQLTALVRRAPDAAFLRNLLGQTELKLGKLAQAAETLALATRLSDNDPLYQADEALAHVALGRAALERGDLSGAMSAFQTAQALDPRGDEVNRGLAEGYLARARYRVRVGDPARAIEELDSARSYLATIEDDELTEQIASAFYSAGRKLELRRQSAGGEVGDELRAFQAAYELDPENLTYQRKLAETQNTLGDQYLAAGNYRDAAYAYQYAYEVYAYEESYRDSAISAFLAWGDERVDAYDHHQAITAYQAAYDLDHSNETAKFSLAEAFNRRGLFYRSLGEDFYSQAADDFLAALDLYPDNEDYQANYDSVS